MDSLIPSLPSRDDPRWDSKPSITKFRYPIRMRRDDANREGLRLSGMLPPERGIYEEGPFICTDSPYHTGYQRWAMDFLVPDGTPVVAAATGFVQAVHEAGELFGNGPEYCKHLNFAILFHYSGEYTVYAHLAKGSVSENGISVGRMVQRGDRIGTVGKSGDMLVDQLHFCVWVPCDPPIGGMRFKSLRPRFEHPDGECT